MENYDKKLNINFHIGYHKTASTWFQKYAYNMHPQINFLNTIKNERNKNFYDLFIEPDNINFNIENFYKYFFKNFQYNDDKYLNLICDENLTGHSWTGRGSYDLMNRIKLISPNSKIIISIRRQDEMLKSLYSNYIISGGTFSLKRLINDVNHEGHLIFKKLEYHHLIQKYLNLFGEENVFIYKYEDFKKNPILILKKIFKFLGLIYNPSIEKKLSTKINISTNSFSRFFIRMSNISYLTYKHSYIFRKFDKFSLKSSKKLDNVISDKVINNWRNSNSILNNIRDLDLDAEDYFFKQY